MLCDKVDLVDRELLARPPDASFLEGTLVVTWQFPLQEVSQGTSHVRSEDGLAGASRVFAYRVGVPHSLDPLV